jgi:hypothetical protein
MIAKVRTVAVSPAAVEPGVSYLQGTMLPAAREIDGFRGMIGLVDRQSGRAITVTLWESAEALEASEAAGARLRSQDGAPASRATVERYEVIVNEVVGSAKV